MPLFIMKKKGKKECSICNRILEEEFDKLQGTIIKVRDENKKPQEIFVCNECMKKSDWIEVAIIKAA